MTNESRDSNENGHRYNYIGYSQDFPLEQHKYALQPDLLLKLAREATKKRDFYKAIRYLNIILIKNPNNQQAKFYKRQVLEIMDQMKRSRNKNVIQY